MTKKRPVGRPPALTKRAEVVAALKAARWVVEHAALALGVSKPSLYGAMKRLRIVRRPVDPAFFSEQNRRVAQAPRPNRRTRVA